MKKTFLHSIALCTSLLLGAPVSFASVEGATLHYQLGEKAFTAHVETATSPAKGTVFIFHDWDGLTD